MKHLCFFFALLLTIQAHYAQVFNAQIYLKDNQSVSLNQVYVTNMRTDQTVLSNIKGNFVLPVKLGDIIRFTSVITNRVDVKIDANLLAKSNNSVFLDVADMEIKEIVLSRFKPSNNYPKDLLKLKINNDKMERLNRAIGLPNGKDFEPELDQIASFNNGMVLNINAIYELLSGENKKKKRLYEYEKMKNNLNKINHYYGDIFFINQKIPLRLVNDFLQFVYLSDNIENLVEKHNYASISFYINKYLPIYLQRIKNSNLLEIVGN